MSKHLKTSSRPHPQPSQRNGKDQERYIVGSIGVTGQIETKLPHDLVEEYKTSNRYADSREQERDKREGWRFIVEMITLGFVVFVAVLGTIQARQAIKTANAALEANRLTKTNFWFDERPFIGTRFLGMPTAVPKQFDEPVASFAYKNYGKGPALNVKVATWVFTGSDQQQEVDAWFARLGNGPLTRTSSFVTARNGVRHNLVTEDFEMPGEEKPQATLGYKPFVTGQAATVAARIEYSDIGGNRYWTDICWITFPEAKDGAPNYARCLNHDQIH